MNFVDSTGKSWIVSEEFDDALVAGAVVFSSHSERRVAWGTPIDWQSPCNLQRLFSLSVPLIDQSSRQSASPPKHK